MGDGGGARNVSSLGEVGGGLGGWARWAGGGVEGVAGCLLINSCIFFFFFETSSGVHRESTSALKKRKPGTLTY